MATSTARLQALSILKIHFDNFQNAYEIESKSSQLDNKVDEYVKDFLAAKKDALDKHELSLSEVCAVLTENNLDLSKRIKPFDEQRKWTTLAEQVEDSQLFRFFRSPSYFATLPPTPINPAVQHNVAEIMEGGDLEKMEIVRKLSPNSILDHRNALSSKASQWLFDHNMTTNAIAAFNYAIQKNDKEQISVYLKNCSGKDLDDAFLLAAKDAPKNTVFLAERGANLDAQDSDGHTAIHL